MRIPERIFYFQGAHEIHKKGNNYTDHRDRGYLQPIDTRNPRGNIGESLVSPLPSFPEELSEHLREQIEKAPPPYLHTTIPHHLLLKGEYIQKMATFFIAF
jgi:hypothetical protein